MRKLFGYLGSLVLGLGLLACSNPLSPRSVEKTENGEVRLLVSDGRTLTSNLSLVPVKYVATFTHATLPEITKTFTLNTAATVSLAAGTWGVTLDALNQGDAVVGRASASVSVEPGVSKSLTLTLGRVSGNGTLKVVASLEGVSASSPALTVDVLGPSETVVASGLTFTYSAVDGLYYLEKSLPNGGYTLKVTLKNGASVIGSGTEAIDIVAQALTAGGLTFLGASPSYMGIFSMDIPVSNTVAAPVLSPSVGTVSDGTTVTFTSATPGAEFRYTVNGTEPTSASTLGSSVVIDSTKTIKVKAFKTGMLPSATVTAVYTVKQGEVYDGIRVYVKGYTHIHYWATVPAQPQSTWPGVALLDHATGWKYYQFPGATSTKLIFSNAGAGQTSDLIREAQGDWWYKNGTWTDYDPDRPQVPVIASSLDTSKKYDKAQTLVLTGSNPDDKIYYTLDGTTPTAASSLFATGLTLNPNPSALVTVKALGINREGTAGAVAVFQFDIKTSNDVTPPTVSANPPAGTYEGAQSPVFTIADDKVGVVAYYTLDGTTPTTSSPILAQTATGKTANSASLNLAITTRLRVLVKDAAGNTTLQNFYYRIGEAPRTDFRKETIYFLMTTRFYDGDNNNNFYCWDDAKAGNLAKGDPAWRGDFLGLAQKLDYIKALGFSAIWITPVVKNMSGYDYHGYHAVDHSQVDPRYESSNYSYQDLINDVHSRGMKLIQDVVLNHTGNFGEENIHPLFKADANGDYLNWLDATKLEANAALEEGAKVLGGTYATLTPGNQFQARIKASRQPLDVNHTYHNHEFKGGWEQYEVQIGSIAGDCQDLDTENPRVAQYLRDTYITYINRGVDAFRVDTVKHINRLTFNKEFIPQFKAAGGDDFFIFGEVATRYRSIWNDGKPSISTPFYTWKENKSYPWGTWETNTASVLQNYNDNLSSGNQPSSTNHLLSGNNYHTPDWSKRSGLDVIDFPMHWAFNNINDAWTTATGGDHAYNDATFNVTYVDSHDYAPDGAPENKRYVGSWPDKLSLIFTFRGIPTIYYGTEIEFMKGAPIDVGPNAPLSTTGRAYFGDHIQGTVNVSDFGKYSGATGTMATTLNHDLAKHIRNLNLIRRAVPALQLGQYSIDGISASGQAFKRRYTNGDENIDSFALVAVNGGATFTGIPNGTYRDVVTGDVKTVTGGSLTAACEGMGNLRVYVLFGGTNQPDPGKVAESGLMYLK